MPSIKKLVEQDVHFYMPLGIGAHMERWGVPEERIHEFDWWEKTTLEAHGVELVSTPSRHFSGRAGIDANRTLWTSWTILGPKHRVYFSGDSGYSPHFKEIGDKYGPFDLTMVEVGAYHEAWGDIHLGPHHAMQAHLDLGGKKMLPVHWGTFDLALHSWTHPARVLAEEAPGKQIQLVTPRVGEPIEPTSSTTTKPWWEALGRE
jgi:L-ascorbate metabolism protein UlaG (beta-lactamase superfamily)